MLGGNVGISVPGNNLDQDYNSAVGIELEFGYMGRFANSDFFIGGSLLSGFYGFTPIDPETTASFNVLGSSIVAKLAFERRGAVAVQIAGGGGYYSRRQDTPSWAYTIRGSVMSKLPAKGLTANLDYGVLRLSENNYNISFLLAGVKYHF